jgi:hypothetical protein
MISVLKKYVENTKGFKLNMKIFFFQAIEGIKTLKIEGIKKHREDIRGHSKGPQNYILKAMKNIKRILWALKILVF